MSEKTLGELAESLIDFCNATESAAFNLRRQIKALMKAELKVRISEERFTVLKWQDEKGSKLGSFQVAYRRRNLPEKWRHAYNILKANNSLIADPFHEEGYEFRYWIYSEKYADRIFRKKQVD